MGMILVERETPRNKKARELLVFDVILKLYEGSLCVFSLTYSGTSPKASTDRAAVVYPLMYSLAVFWT